MHKNKTQPLSWTEHMGVIMTPDKKCIIRGKKIGYKQII